MYKNLGIHFFKLVGKQKEIFFYFLINFLIIFDKKIFKGNSFVYFEILSLNFFLKNRFLATPKKIYI